ncbi:hypothetical protein, partial [Escherichia coli]|uniref:hypothetical protein n=1 Tax=Escherichia coli TaxID=562 RepID=UPI003EE2C9BB
LSTKADRIILKKTVNGSRNPFAGREALDKRSASVFPALPRDSFVILFKMFLVECLFFGLLVSGFIFSAITYQEM